MFRPLRVVALYFGCDVGLSTRVLSQAAGQLWPEAAIKELSGVLHKVPCFKGGRPVALVLGPPAWGSGHPDY